MSYRDIIQAETACSDEDTFEVEEMLRQIHGGTLDHLSLTALTSDARVCYGDLLLIRKTDPDWSPDPAMKAARRKRGA